MSATLKNSFTILMNDDLTPHAILTNENEVGLFKKLVEDDKHYRYCDYCSVEIGRTLEYLYRIIWDVENRIYMVAVYKITDKSSELLTHIKCEDLEIRFMMSKTYTDNKQKENEEKDFFYPVGLKTETGNVIPVLDEEEKKELDEVSE